MCIYINAKMCGHPPLSPLPLPCAYFLGDLSSDNVYIFDCVQRENQHNKNNNSKNKTGNCVDISPFHAYVPEETTTERRRRTKEKKKERIYRKPSLLYCLQSHPDQGHTLTAPPDNPPGKTAGIPYSSPF